MEEDTSKIWDTTGTVFIQGPLASRRMDGPCIKTVPIVSHIFGVFLPRGSESRAVGPVGKMNKKTTA